jgi:endoglucanase
MPRGRVARLRSIFLVAFAGVVLPLVPAAAEVEPVPAERLERMTRGVNLSHWFSQIPGGGAYRREWFESYLGPADFRGIAQAGFLHVRFAVELEMFLDNAARGRLRPEFLDIFDRSLDSMRAAGLAVILDWQAREETKQRLATDEAFVVQAAALWHAMARHLAGRDPGWLFLETLNEPARAQTAAQWYTMQRRFIEAIRSAAPRHTIVAGGPRWSGVDDLVGLSPYDQGNLVYNFHFYEPMVFTHQGAGWPDMGLEPIAGLRYPTEPDSMRENLERIGDGRGRRHLEAYAADRAWVERRLGEAAAWARLHGRPITCNEFGVYTRATPPADRLAWLRDVRETCERLGIGWTMWDYAGGFRVLQPETTGAARRMDSDCLRALGLLGRSDAAAPAMHHP